jgi:hypothetical protein
MKNDVFFKNHIHTLDCLLVNDIWQFWLELPSFWYLLITEKSTYTDWRPKRFSIYGRQYKTAHK